MDQLASSRASEREAPRASARRGRGAKRFAWSLLAAMALGGGLVAGFFGGRTNWPLPAWLPAPMSTFLNGNQVPSAGPEKPIAYYRDPDGRLAYSLAPKKTDDGRDYLPVRVDEDVSVEDEPAAPVLVVDSGTGAGQAGSSSGRKILYYRNPMGLPDTSPVPKKDSMGMDYLPVYEGEAEGGSTVKVSPGKLQRTGVRSEAVERRIVSRPVRVPGTVQLDERRVTVVATRSEAFIDKVENITTGDRVLKGQPLVQLYSPEINAAAALLTANPGFEGSRRRLRNLNVPGEAIAEMERTRKVPLSIQWSAPRDGLVLERNAVEGMRAAAGDVLFRIADVSTVWVLADVPEHDLGSVKVGQPVTVRVRSLPGRTLTGQVGLIYPQVNKETRTTRVRVELANPESALLPDMYAEVEIATGAAEPVVAVPDNAVIDTGTRRVVIVDKGEGRFESREVKVGERGNGLVEIREGVAEGDKVVVSANFLIDAESNLAAALQGMAAAPAEGKPR